jgi:hypothetical protein
VFEIHIEGKVMMLLPMLLFQLPSPKNSKSAESSLASSLIHAWLKSDARVIA